MTTGKARYGPQAPFERAACATLTPHVGGVHLDPTSDLYDGPGTRLLTLPASCRKAAEVLLDTAREQGWDKRVVETALHELASEIHRLRDQVAAVRVDRDRGIDDAMKRAEDCAEHGADLRHERHQAYWFWTQNDALDQQRQVWVSACHDIEDAFRASGQADSDLGKWVSKRVRSAAQAQDRVARRHSGPTHADCQAAGRCEHPSTPTHGACEQLRETSGVYRHATDIVLDHARDVDPPTLAEHLSEELDGMDEAETNAYRQQVSDLIRTATVTVDWPAAPGCET